MSEPLDRLFEQLRGQLPPAPFAPAEEVRRRGRRRRFHQSIVVGVAMLAVTGLGTGSVAVALRPAESTPPPAAAPAVTGPATTAPSAGPASPDEPAPTLPTPERTEIPDGWLLTAADLAGNGWEHNLGELLEGPWFWGGGQWCTEYSVEDYGSLAERVDRAATGWARVEERVDQVVELFTADGAAARNMDDVLAYLGRCSKRASSDGSVAGIVHTVEDTGFAGERSLLIQAESYYFNDFDEIVPAPAQLIVVVQVGHAVTTIRFEPPADVYAVAERAADRLVR